MKRRAPATARSIGGAGRPRSGGRAPGRRRPRWTAPPEAEAGASGRGEEGGCRGTPSRRRTGRPPPTPPSRARQSPPGNPNPSMAVAPMK